MSPQTSFSVPAVGAVIAGKYRIERTVAEGGMGVVMAATHLHLGRCVAVKFLRAELGDGNLQWDALARFSLEAKIVARLRSEHVASVLDAGVTDDGTPYMVMELLEGFTLAQTLQTRGAFNIATAVECAIQACEGLADAHSHGIVHRDIKPHNLFLVERASGWNIVKIVDFGISKVLVTDEPNVVTRIVVGSPCYMSPEQLRSTPTIDHRSDIWSLGATLYELLTARSAFDQPSQTLPELVAAILEKRAPSLRELRPDVPAELEAIVARCMAKDREARFQSTGELAMALLAFAPPRARVPAERAAAMKPAFPVSAPSSTGSTASAGSDDSADHGSDSRSREWPDTRHSPTRSSAPTSNHRPGATGTSLAPMAMVSSGLGELPTPPPSSTFVEQKQPDMRVEGARKFAWRPRALVAAAAFVWLSIMVMVATRGDDNKAKSVSKSVAVPAMTVPVPATTQAEAPPPTVTLTRLEPSVPTEVTPSRGAEAPGHAKVDTERSPATDPVPPSRSRPTVAQARATRHVSASVPVPAGRVGPALPQSAATPGVEVNPQGGKIPLRPIEARDPYGSL